MPIPTAQLLTWSRVVANRRAAVINEFIPGGLEDLASFTYEETKEAIKSFRTYTTPAQRFSLSALSAKRIETIILGEGLRSSRSTSRI
jgi:hypothetical protein